jgi:hypothetical protein
MILMPLEADEFPRALDVFNVGLADNPAVRAVFRCISATKKFCPGFKADLHAGRQKAIDLAARMGIATLDEDPATAFSWDGQAIRTRSETSVVFHEIAHWQIAPPARRALYDFGLGAGPESGLIAEANQVCGVDVSVQEEEENLASLLGILWETKHDEPAVLAFAEQNWLAFYDRPHTWRHFGAYVYKLQKRGLINDEGRPLMTQ